MRLFIAGLALAAAAFTSAPASAQLVAVHLKEGKATAKYKDYISLYRGQPVVIGEPWSNLKVDLERNTIGRIDGNNNLVEILRPDPGDPLKLPFKVQGDERKITNSDCKVGISAEHIDSFSIWSRESSVAGLATDYSARKQVVDELRAERDARTKGGPEWMMAQQRMLTNMERLRAWLESGLFPEAAQKLEKEIAKERKVVVGEALTARRESAKSSVKPCEVPESLVRVAGEIDPSHKFHGYESRHCRILFRDGIDELRVRELLVLAEEIIDGFRVDFVDPYLEAEYPDHIPEQVVIEWFFGYDDVAKHERYLSTYYRMSWDPKRREESVQMPGHGMRRGPGLGVDYIHMWRVDDQADLEGMVAHNLGHDLANLHYDKRRMNMTQDWLEEGLGLYLSLEWLGRNSVNCKGWAEPGRYVHKDKKVEGAKTFQMGLRDWYNAMALEAGAPIDKMALKTLYEMNDGDLAKSWSIVDWIAKKTGKEGQLFLREGCAASRTKTFIADWRKKAEAIFGVTGKDVFDVVDARWKAFAQAGQETGDVRKRN